MDFKTYIDKDELNEGKRPEDAVYKAKQDAQKKLNDIQKRLGNKEPKDKMLLGLSSPEADKYRNKVKVQYDEICDALDAALKLVRKKAI